MSVFISIVGAIFAFFIIVLVHECGHFFVARLLKVRVLEFSIGFGKALFKRTAKSGVCYAIRVIPLGGYVRMDDGETPSDGAKGSAGFPLPSRPLWMRILVVLAGPAVNLILAVLLLWSLYTIGVTQLKPVVGRVMPNSIAAKAGVQADDQITQVGQWKAHNWQQVLMGFFMHLGSQDTLPVMVISPKTKQPESKQFNMQQWVYNPQKPALLQSLGITPKRPKIKPIIANVVSRSPAKNLLFSGDEILSANQVKITDWFKFVKVIQSHPKKQLKLIVQRAGGRKAITVTPDAHIVAGKAYGYLGVTPKISKIPADLSIHVQYPFYSAWYPAITETWRLIAFHFIAIKQMILGKVSLKSLGGPISIFRSAGMASQAGVKAYISFLALISIIIGVLNLLPIPALDGGHLLFYLIEAVIRRPVSARAQYFITLLGIIFLIFLMTYATINDLTRLFS